MEHKRVQFLINLQPEKKDWKPANYSCWGVFPLQQQQSISGQMQLLLVHIVRSHYFCPYHNVSREEKRLKANVLKSIRIDTQVSLKKFPHCLICLWHSCKRPSMPVMNGMLFKKPPLCGETCLLLLYFEIEHQSCGE